LLIDVSPLPDGPESPTFQPRESYTFGTTLEEPGPPIQPGSDPDPASNAEPFTLAPLPVPESPERFDFSGSIPVGYESAGYDESPSPTVSEDEPQTLNALATLKPLGQLRDSFILAVNEEGLWIVDQHVAHERVLFEKILREREVEQVQRQRLLMPLLIDLLPAQMVAFATIAEELDRNGFEAEPFGPRTLAIKAAPVGLEGRELERMLEEVLAVPEREQQTENSETRRRRIAASIACHAAIKVNMPLEPAKIDWLLQELAKTEHPTSCPHGRPIALKYTHKDIQKAFQRI
jgi:DNA mismatch repair protein MutL